MGFHQLDCAPAIVQLISVHNMTTHDNDGLWYLKVGAELPFQKRKRVGRHLNRWISPRPYCFFVDHVFTKSAVDQAVPLPLRVPASLHSRPLPGLWVTALIPVCPTGSRLTPELCPNRSQKPLHRSPRRRSWAPTTRSRRTPTTTARVRLPPPPPPHSVSPGLNGASWNLVTSKQTCQTWNTIFMSMFLISV